MRPTRNVIPKQPRRFYTAGSVIGKRGSLAVRWTIVLAVTFLLFLPSGGAFHPTVGGTHEPSVGEALADHPLSPAHPVASLPAPLLSHGNTSVCKASKKASGLIEISVNVSVSCLWNETTLKGLVVPANNTNTTLVIPDLSVSGGGIVNMTGGWRITIAGSFSVVNQTSVNFNRTDHLTISNSSGASFSVGSAAKVLLNGIGVYVASGSPTFPGATISLSNGTLYGGLRALPKGTPPIFANVSLSGPGRLRSLSVGSASIQYVNVTSVNITSMSIEGSYASPVSVVHFNVSYDYIRNLYVDDALVNFASFQQVGNLTVGNSTTTSPDRSSINHLNIATTVPGSASFVHTSVGAVSWSGASRVNLVNSTLSRGAQNTTEATSSLNVTEGSVFDFPVELNSTAELTWVNSTAPGLVLNSGTHARIYNWPLTTNQSSAGQWKLASIVVDNHSATVSVYRYLLISVVGPSGSPSTSNVTLQISSSSSPGVQIILPPASLYGLFLYTDNFSGQGYTFVGTYTLTATAGGMSASRTLNVTAQGMQVVLQLTAPPSVFFLSNGEILYLEIGALAATVVGTVYLVVRIRRESSKLPPASGEEHTPSTSL